MSPWERLEGPGWWNGGPARPPPAPGAPRQGGHCPLGPFAAAQAGRGEETPSGTSGVPPNPEYPSAEGSGVGLVPLPGCARAVPKANHNSAKGLPCFGPHRGGHCPHCQLEPHGHQPPQNHTLESGCAPALQQLRGSTSAFFQWSPQINLSLRSWPECCHLKGSCGPRCPSATRPAGLGALGAPACGDKGHGPHLAARCIPVPAQRCRSADADPGGVSEVYWH